MLAMVNTTHNILGAHLAGLEASLKRPSVKKFLKMVDGYVTENDNDMNTIMYGIRLGKEKGSWKKH
jgi:hypothetical protein